MEHGPETGQWTQDIEYNKTSFVYTSEDSDFCHLSVAGQNCHLSNAIQAVHDPHDTHSQMFCPQRKKNHLSQISFER